MKKELAVLQSYSLRSLIEQVNRHNAGNPDHPILKEDIVNVISRDDTFFLLYFK